MLQAVEDTRGLREKVRATKVLKLLESMSVACPPHLLGLSAATGGPKLYITRYTPLFFGTASSSGGFELTMR